MTLADTAGCFGDANADQALASLLQRRLASTEAVVPRLSRILVATIAGHINAGGTEQ